MSGDVVKSYPRNTNTFSPIIGICFILGNAGLTFSILIVLLFSRTNIVKQNKLFESDESVCRFYVLVKFDVF